MLRLRDDSGIQEPVFVKRDCAEVRFEDRHHSRFAFFLACMMIYRMLAASLIYSAGAKDQYIIIATKLGHILDKKPMDHKIVYNIEATF